MGPQREIPGAVPGRPGDHEQQSDLVAAARYAFATRQADVFAAVQRLRRLAQANDKLQSSPQQVVSTQQVTVEPEAGSSQPPRSRR